MKTLLVKIALIATILFFFIGCGSDEIESVPKPIATFLSEYFPLQPVSQYGFDGNTYHVKLRNSSALTFDNTYKWVSVNGYGNTLPEIFLFDELPPALYAYLQDISLTNEVYSVTRDGVTYNVMLLDHSVTYIIATGEVSSSHGHESKA